MPRVSVIIPTYNRRDYLQEAIDSVLAQSYAGYEVIVVDDGSTDGTGEALAARYGERIRYLWQENRGESTARNRGIALARGTYVALLDSDDLWLPDKLALQVPLLEGDPRAGMAFCQAWLIDARGQRIADTPQGDDLAGSGSVLEELCLRNPIAPSTTLIRCSTLSETGGFDPAIRYGEDWDLWVRIAARYPILYTAQPLALLRRHSGTQCYYPAAGRNARRLADHLRILDKAFSAHPDLLTGERQDEARAHQYLLAGLADYAVGEANGAREHWRTAAHLAGGAFADEAALAQLIVDHALAAAEGETAVDPERALVYVERVCSDPHLAHRVAFGRRMRAQLHATLGFGARGRRDWRQVRHHLARAVRWDATWLRNGGVRSLLFESLLGSRFAAWLRRRRSGSAPTATGRSAG